MPIRRRKSRSPAYRKTPPTKKIRIRQVERPSELKSLCTSLDYEWPPRHQIEAVAILAKAGFTQRRIEQCLAMTFTNVEGGELPEYYVSSRGKDRPIFSAMLAEGLRKHVAEHKPQPVKGVRLWQAAERAAVELNDVRDRVK